MLSFPSTLQGHSDFPTPITGILPGSSDLNQLTTDGNLRRRQDLRSNICFLSPHAIGLTPGLPRVLVPFTSSRVLAFPISVEGRQVSHQSIGFIPQPDSPSYNSPALCYGAAPFALCYGLRIWLAPLTGYDLIVPSRHGTLSRQVQPECYHPNPPPAYIPKRVTGMVVTLQTTRKQTRNRVHACLTCVFQSVAAKNVRLKHLLDKNYARIL